MIGAGDGDKAHDFGRAKSNLYVGFHVHFGYPIKKNYKQFLSHECIVTWLSVVLTDDQGSHYMAQIYSCTI